MTLKHPPKTAFSSSVFLLSGVHFHFSLSSDRTIDLVPVTPEFSATFHRQVKMKLFANFSCSSKRDSSMKNVWAGIFVTILSSLPYGVCVSKLLTTSVILKDALETSGIGICPQWCLVCLCVTSYFCERVLCKLYLYLVKVWIRLGKKKNTNNYLAKSKLFHLYTQAFPEQMNLKWLLVGVLLFYFFVFFFVLISSSVPQPPRSAQNTLSLHTWKSSNISPSHHKPYPCRYRTNMQTSLGKQTFKGRRLSESLLCHPGSWPDSTPTLTTTGHIPADVRITVSSCVREPLLYWPAVSIQTDLIRLCV